MSDNQKPHRRFRTFLIALAVLAAAVWFGHPPVAAWILERMVGMAAAREGWKVSIGQTTARIGRPVTFDEIRLARGSETRVDIRHIEISLGGLPAFLTENSRWIQRVLVRGVEGEIDMSSLPQGEGPVPPPTLKLLPAQVQIEDLSLTWMNGPATASVRSLNARLRENAPGMFDLAELRINSGKPVSIGPLSGTTAWNSGTLWIGGVTLRDGLTIEAANLELLREGGPALSFRLGVFGGFVRGDATLAEPLEAAIYATGVPLTPLAALNDPNERVAGVITEARLTFRGDPARPADAEGSLRLTAEGVRWRDRAWEFLEAGASLVHRRLMVSKFDLRQKENHIACDGEVSLAEGWSQLAKAPFLLNVRADVRNLAELGRLAGGDSTRLAGRMTATAEVSGREGLLDGFLSIEASGISVGNTPPLTAKIETVFRKKEAEIAQCDLYAGNDKLNGRGTIEIASPHTYAGEFSTKVADIAKYLAPFFPGGSPVSGAIEGTWQGDGTMQAHSGAFKARASQLVTPQTPGGLSGEFAGTYSPQNVYFSNVTLTDGRLRFSSRATISAAGLNVLDAELRTGNTLLVEGEAFLPVNLFAVAGGSRLADAVAPDVSSYARIVTPKPLELGDLWRLAGQESPVAGMLRTTLELSGPATSLKVAGQVNVTGLKNLATPDLPESVLDLRVAADNGKAVVDGSLTPSGYRPVKLSATMPFGLVKSESGDWKWVNPAGTFEGSAEFPETDVAAFASFFPGARQLGGKLTGGIKASGTIAAPAFNGRLELKNGVLEASTRAPAVTALNVTVVFDGRRATIERFTGEIGAGDFQITGGMSFEGPTYDLKMTGDRVLLARDAGFRLRANVDLTASGGPRGGSLTGSVRFVDGRIYRKIEVTPLLVPTPGQNPVAFSSPIPPGSVPQPFSSWTLNVALVNETPFLIKGNVADGEVVPELRLGGTLGNPLPVGRITLRDVRAFLPFTTMTIPDGRIDFLPDSPWIPMVDIRGTASMPDYEVQAYLFGPLNENKLILRSEPPLPQESLVLLLTTGILPQQGGSGFADVAISQGGLLLLRTAARGLNVPGVDMDDLVNRFSLSTTPPQGPGERATLRGNFRVWDQLEIMTGRDGYGFYQGGLTYTWRFK